MIMKRNSILITIVFLLFMSCAYQNQFFKFGSGYAFYTDYNSIETNDHSEEILKLLGEWEKARMSRVFNDDQKQHMHDIKSHLKT